MVRKLAAGTSAAGPAAAPAGESGDPSGDDLTAGSFVFGPLADVPHLLSRDRACPAVASPPAGA